MRLNLGTHERLAKQRSDVWSALQNKVDLGRSSRNHHKIILESHVIMRDNF